MFAQIWRRAARLLCASPLKSRALIQTDGKSLRRRRETQPSASHLLQPPSPDSSLSPLSFEHKSSPSRVARGGGEDITSGIQTSRNSYHHHCNPVLYTAPHPPTHTPVCLIPPSARPLQRARAVKWHRTVQTFKGSSVCFIRAA